MLLKAITKWSGNADLQAQSDNYQKRLGPWKVLSDTGNYRKR